MEEKEKNKTIIITYKTNKRGKLKIFGDKFVQNNNKNICIKEEKNLEPTKLAGAKKINEEINTITLEINEDLSDLSHMFHGCEDFYEISIQNFKMKKITNFSAMFCECSSLTNIESLKNWDVSAGTNFQFFFRGCKKLQSLKDLENWNVEKGKNFRGMFTGCSSLKSLVGLKKWNVSKGELFGNMFSKCTSLSDISDLGNWNVKNGTDFKAIF